MTSMCFGGQLNRPASSCCRFWETTTYLTSGRYVRSRSHGYPGWTLEREFALVQVQSWHQAMQFLILLSSSRRYNATVSARLKCLVNRLCRIVISTLSRIGDI